MTPQPLSDSEVGKQSPQMWHHFITNAGTAVAVHISFHTSGRVAVKRIILTSARDELDPVTRASLTTLQLEAISSSLCPVIFP